MTSNAMYARPYGGWQFSLKSLMFVTMVVAVGAALIHISVALAVLLIPLFAAGLLRTIRVVTRAETDGVRPKAPGLFVTFCRSIALIVAMIAVGMTAISFAGVTAILIAVMLLIHVCRVTGVISHPIVNRARRGLFRFGKWCWSTLTRIQPVAILRWFQAHAVTSTLSLCAVCRRLSGQWWSTENYVKRTDPL